MYSIRIKTARRMHMDDLELYDLFALLHIERREELGLSL